MKKIIIILSIFTLCIPNFVLASDVEVVSTSTSVLDEVELATSSKSAILIEASTGEILFEKNSHEKLTPASMTKMMSMLLILESIENKVISWDELITISANASSMGGSQILLETNEQMSVEDLFKGIAIASGNDAVVALAEAVAGTVGEFVKMMNTKAKELGLTDTVFQNPHGLDEVDHYSSAYDMSLIAKELVRHEKVLEFSSIYEEYLRKGTDRETWLVNTNKLVRFYQGVDGLKTGYTNEAGYCLTATANKNNMRLIAVVMGEPDSSTRNSEVSAMLDYGYSQYKIDNILDNDTVLAKVDVEKGKTEYAEIVTIEDVKVLNKKINKLGKITYELNVNKIKSSINKGDKVGTLVVKSDDKIIANVDVTVKNSIKKAKFLELYFNYLGDIFKGNIKLIK